MTRPSDVAELALEWRCEAGYVGRGHYKAADRAAKWHTVMGTLNALFSAGIVAGLLFSLERLDGEAVPFRMGAILAGLSLLASLLTALQSFIGFDQGARQHASAAAAYEELGRRLDLAMSDGPVDVELLSCLREQMNELARTTPLIPHRAYLTGQDEIDQGIGHLGGRGAPRNMRRCGFAREGFDGDPR